MSTLSPRYAWCVIIFGMTWRLMLTNLQATRARRAFFLFGGTDHGNAEEATNGWISMFDDTRRGTLYHYRKVAPLRQMRSCLPTSTCTAPGWRLLIQHFHDFTFTPGVSVVLPCPYSGGIDYYWEQLGYT